MALLWLAVCLTSVSGLLQTEEGRVKNHVRCGGVSRWFVV